MPSSHWREKSASITLGLLLLSVFSWLFWDLSVDLAEQRIRDEQSAQRHTQHADERVTRECAALEAVSLRNCIQEQIETAADQYRAEQDLRAQESMAKFTAIMGYTAVVGIAIGIGSVYLIYATLRETRRMANDTQRIGEAQVRAYLDITLTSVHFEQDVAPILGLTVRNLGQTPVRDLLIKVRMAYRGYAPEKAEFFIKEACLIYPDLSINREDKLIFSSAPLDIPVELDKNIGEVADIRFYIGAFGNDIFGEDIFAIRLFQSDKHKGFEVIPLAGDVTGEAARSKFDAIQYKAPPEAAHVRVMLIVPAGLGSKAEDD